MATIDRFTGRPLEGIDDVWQSIATILSTPLAGLVMARDFGSKMPRLVDRAVSQVTLIEFYAAVPDAINRINPEALMAEEPRFRIIQMTLADMTDAGHATFDIDGIYYPRGHLGDYSEARDAQGRVIVANNLVIGSYV
ncbi:GPW/gp25 family protein [Bradyrhizobium retamae]|uniref:Phage baseplate protein n=1 Tax=Bradyrhizobium retamae TaxID=1300035 RepID=A0A0R3MPT4_9BRAD|nr:phage baseplate protein [Bradyrhizobium retamae]KRR21708.1 phage baseplate protein [Bradyrhizobium retamae]